MWFRNIQQPIIALAPMADMTDSPFCCVCREVSLPRPSSVDFGVAKDFVIFREMVSAEAIVRGNEKTLKMCEFDPIEKPIVLQLFGSDPDILVEATIILKERSFTPSGIRDFDGIDINMGCPVPKIAQKSNSGAALMRDHNKAMSIVKSLKNANLGVPVSVKTRLGWTDDHDILEFAQKLEQAGADLLTIHGRTRKQGYSGVANWERIAEVKKLVSIPVIANGDINSSEDIERCLEVTGADGVMIGRGALGNPWIFLPVIARNESSSDEAIYQRCEIASPNKNRVRNDLKEVVLRHAELHLGHYGEEFGLRTFRKHLLHYFKGIPGVKKYKPELVQVESLEDLKEILKFF